MTELLFLDIDGVLNQDDSIEKGYWTNWSGVQSAGIDKRNADPLAEWLRARPEVRIVISSAWREYHTLLEIVDSLDAAGLPADRVLGVTPTFPYQCNRGHEIANWIEDHVKGAARIAICDDLNAEAFDALAVYLHQIDGFRGFAAYNRDNMVLYELDRTLVRIASRR